MSTVIPSIIASVLCTMLLRSRGGVHFSNACVGLTLSLALIGRIDKLIPCLLRACWFHIAFFGTLMPLCEVPWPTPLRLKDQIWKMAHLCSHTALLVIAASTWTIWDDDEVAFDLAAPVKPTNNYRWLNGPKQDHKTHSTMTNLNCWPT